MGHWTVPCMVLPGLNADVTYNKNYLPMGMHGVYYIENFLFLPAHRVHQQVMLFGDPR